MRTRPLGKTGLDVSELALGTWGLSGDAYGPVVEREIDRVIDRAVTLGITLFDTADVYGRGDMERRLGERLPEGAHIVTKIGTDLDASPARKRFDVSYLREAFSRSRDRLRRARVDVVLLHNPSMSALRGGVAIPYLKELKSAGDVTAWGVSAGSTEVASEAMRQGADVVELAYNVFNAQDLHALAEPIASGTTAVLARSVLAHGLLAGFWSPDREFYPGDHRAERWTCDELRRRIRQLDTLRPLVSGNLHTLRAVALRFVLSTPLVTSAVLGPRSTAQLDQLVRDAGTAPPYLRDTQLADLGERLKAAGLLAS